MSTVYQPWTGIPRLTREDFLSGISPLPQRWRSGEESAFLFWRLKRHGFHPWIQKIPWSRRWQPTPVSLPRESHGQRSLADCRGLQRVRHDQMTERAHTHICPSLLICHQHLWVLKQVSLWIPHSLCMREAGQLLLFTLCR